MNISERGCLREPKKDESGEAVDPDLEVALDLILAHGGGMGGLANAIGVFWALIPLGAVVIYSARCNQGIRRQIEDRARFEEAFRDLEREYREQQLEKARVKL